MASTNGGNIKFGVQFQSNKTGLNQITKSLQAIQTQASKMKVGDQMYEGFQKASKAAKELESILGKSWNDKLGQLNLDKFNQSVKSSYGSVQKLKAELTGVGASGQAAFNSMASQVLNTNVQLRQSNRLLDSMATSMANTVKWGITSAIFNSITGSIQHAYNYAEQLNSSLNNIRIVTGDSADQMDRFARTANEAAKELGRSTLDYTKAAQTFYQQGLGQEEVEARTAVTLKAENITGAGSQMADYLTSVFNGFKVAAADTQGVVDKLAKVADSSASNMSQLAIAMSKVAATANVVGVDVDQLNAMLATVIATTRQAPEAVGTAYKSIFARLNDIATGAEDAEISLGNYSSKMAELGFSVLDATGNLRDTGQVLEQIGGRWDTLTKAQQIYLAQTMGGQRQITQVVALFDNWTKYSELLNESLTAQGTLDEKNNTYLESTAAHLKQLQAEQERTYAALFDMDTVNAAVDALRGITDQFNDFIEGIGGGTNVFIYFGTVIANIFNKQIAQGILTAERQIERFKANLGSVEAKASVINSIKQGLTAKYAGQGKTLGNQALQLQAVAAEKVLAVQRGLTQEQQKQATIIQEQIGLTQQKITDLQEAERIRKQEIQDLQKSQLLQGKSIEWIKLKASSLRQAKQLNSQTAIVINQMDYTLQDINDKTLVGVSAQQKRLALAQKLETQQSNLLSVWQGQNLAEEDFTKHFDAVIEGLIKGDTATKDFKQHWEAIKTVFQQVNASQNRDLATIDAYLTKIGIDTSELTEEERARLAVLLQQNNAYAQQGKHVLNLQTAIRVMSSAGQALSAIGGALSTAFADGATAADKMNAAFSGVNGTISAALMAIPGIGFALSGVWTGVTSIGKAILQATGVWDDWTESLKSTEEKLEDIKQREKEVAQASTTYTSSKQSIENIAEEFEALAEKRDNNIKLSEEEQTRYHQLVDTITKYNSDAIQGYTSRGQAIVNNNGLIQNTLSLLDKQYQKQMRNAYAGEEFKKTSDTYKSRHKQARQRVEALQDESTLPNRQNQAELDFSQIRSNISGAINENYGLSNFSEDFNNALDSFIGDIGENQEDLDAYIVALENFINSLKQDENLNQDENTAITQLKDYLEGRLNELKDLAGVEGKYQDQLNQAKKELLEASQLPVKEIIGNVKVDSDQYQALKESYGDNFQQLGEGFLDNSITSFLKGLQGKIDSGQITLPEGQDDIVNWAVEQVNQYLSNFYSSYGEALGKAQQNGIKDLQKILSDETLDAADINEAIINSINENFGQLLKNVNPKDFPYLEDIIKRIYNLDSFRTVWNADGTKVVTEVKNYSTKLQEDIISAVSGGKANSQITNLFDDLDLSTQQLEKLKQNIDTFHPRFQGFNDFKQYVLDFFKDVEDTSNTQKIIENFSKVESAINKITSGKNLSHKDKLNLQQVLGLTSEDMASLTTNAQWLNRIKEQILSIPDNADNLPVKIQAVIDTYDNLADVRRDYGEDSEVYQYAAPEVFEKQAEAAKVDIETLKLYAETRHLAFTTTEDQENVLNLYKQSTSVTEAANTIKVGFDTINQSFKDLASGKKDVNEVTIQLDKLRDAWNLLTGQNVSLESFINQLDLMAIAIQTGITDLSRLRQLQAQGYQGGAVQQYNQAEAKVQSGEQAAKNFASGNVSEEDAARLSQMEAEWQALRDVAAQYGRDSQQYLDMVNRISEAERAHLSTVRDEKLAIIENNKKIIQQQIEQLKHEGETAGLQRRKEITEQIAQKTQQLHSLDDEQSQLQFQDSAPRQFKLDSDIKTEDFQNLKDYIRDNIKQLEDFDESLVDNDKALQEVTSDLLRYEAALKKVEKNYSKWSKALTDGSIQENAQAMEELRDTYGDILGFPADALSDSFAGSTQNLQLMQQAMNGSEEAYDQLMQAAQQDIEAQCHIDMDDTQFWDKKNEVQAAMDQMNFQDIEVGASLNDEGFLQALTDMVNAAGMTANQATAYLASMGVDAQVTTDTTSDQSQSEHANWIPTINSIPMQYTAYAVSGTGPNTQLLPLQQTGYVPQVTYTNNPQTGTEDVEQKSFALKVTSANKSSGGGIKHKESSGGGSGNKGKSGGCFVAGTPVSLVAGFKNIEDIQIGDIVLSYNEQFGINEYSTVLQTMIHDVEEQIFTLYIENEELIVTGIHRFLITRGKKKEWIPAAELEVGDLVLFADGTLHTIFKIDVEVRAEKVYNFQVSNNHNYYVGKNKILAHNKGGGGGGAEKAATGHTNKMSKRSQIDRYHDVNLKLQKVANKLTDIDRQKQKLTGDKYLDKLKEQTKQLQNQQKLHEEKLRLQKQELKQIQQELKYQAKRTKGKKPSLKKQAQSTKFDYSKYYKNIVDKDIFNDDGSLKQKITVKNKKGKKKTVSTYQYLMQQAFNQYQSIIKKYNSIKTDKQQKKYKESTLDPAKERYQNFKTLIEQLDTMSTETIPELQDQIDKEIDEIVNKNIEQFKLKIEVELDTRQAQRDYNEFRRKVVENIKQNDVLGNAKVNFSDLGSYYNPISNTGQIKTLYQNLKTVTDAYNTIKAGKEDKTYGKNLKSAEQDMKQLLSQLESSMSNVVQLENTIKQAAYDMADALADAFSYQQSQYDVITDTLNHHLNLVQMIYGEESYAAMSGYYKTIAENNNNELAFLRQQKDYWYQMMQNQKKEMEKNKDDNAKWKQANELFKAYEQQYRDSVNQLNSITESAVQNIIDKYTNSIKQIFGQLNKNLTKYSNLNYINEEWQLLNKKSQQYLDNINSAYEIEKLEIAYQQAIDDNQNNLSAQKSLNDLMEEQLKYLRQKDKLTQYDVDRANALLNVEIKRLALEQARQSKTKLRLRRDSQGNYSYQYTADQNDINKARQELLDAENELYNKTRQAYTNNLNNYYSYIAEWQEKVITVMSDTTLSAEQQDAKVKEYAEIYGELINNTVENNELLKRHLMTDTVLSAERLYGQDESNFNRMSYNERAKSLWLSALEQRDKEATTEAAREQYAKDLENYSFYAGQIETMINDAEGQNGWKHKLSTDTLTALFGDYKINKDTFNQMMNGGGSFQSGMTGIWSNGLTEMIQQMAGQNGFKDIAQGVYKDLCKAVGEYQGDISTLQVSAGKDFASIKAGLQSIGTTQSKLDTAIKDLAQTGTTSFQEMKNYVDSLGTSIGTSIEAVKTYTGVLGEGNEGQKNTLTTALASVAKEVSNIWGNSDKLVTQLKTQNSYIVDNLIPNLTAWEQAYKKVAEQAQNVTKATAQALGIDTSDFEELWKQYVAKKKGEGSGSGTTKTETPSTTPPSSSGNKNNGAVDIDSVATSLGQVKVVPTKVAQVQTVIVNGKKETRTVWRSYDTGGYTGDWNSKDGKMAVLHEKELVLNKEDTKNILNAVSIIRTLSGNLNTMQASLSILSSSLPSNSLNESNLKQNVSIEAHFPNVSNSSEIEDAFNNLINRASQYVLGGR